LTITMIRIDMVSSRGGEPIFGEMGGEARTFQPTPAPAAYPRSRPRLSTAKISIAEMSP